MEGTPAGKTASPEITAGTQTSEPQAEAPGSATAPAGANQLTSSGWTGWASAGAAAAPSTTPLPVATTAAPGEPEDLLAKCNRLCVESSQADPRCFHSLPCSVTPECTNAVSQLSKCMLEDQKDVCASFVGMLESPRGPWGKEVQRQCRDALVDVYKASSGLETGKTEDTCKKPSAQVCIERCWPCWTCKSAGGCLDTRGDECAGSCSPDSYCGKFTDCVASDNPR